MEASYLSLERRLERMRAELSKAVCTALKKIGDIKLPMFALPETLHVPLYDASSVEK